MKTPKLNRNFWIILTTTIILALGYIFYLEVYIANKEDKIISTRLRVLEQIGRNIKDKKVGYTDKPDGIVEEIIKGLNLLDKTKLEEISKSEDSLKFRARNIMQSSKELINEDLLLEDVKWIPNEQETNYLPVQRGIDDNIYFLNNEFTLEKMSGKGKGNISFKVEDKKLLQGLLRYDVFDDFLLIKDSILTYNTIAPGSIILSSTELSSGELLELITGSHPDNKSMQESNLIVLPEETGQRLGSIYSGQVVDVVLLNKAYKLFIMPIDHEEDHWYIGGLMEASHFNAATYSVAPGFIVTLSFLLILIILWLPVIKVFVMSKTEQLHTSTVIYSALTLLVGGSFVALFYFAVAQDRARSHNKDKSLQQLSTCIRKSLYAEMDNIYSQLDAYDKFFGSSIKNSSDSIKINILREDEEDPGYPKEYPYFDFVFWIDSKGYQTAELTPFNDGGELISVKTRDYFDKSDDWFLPPLNDRKFRIESIVSKTSGSRKVAFSIPSKGEDPVIALTARFYSIIDPILPKDHGFCIIDQGGQVWFHSEKERNLRENFIEECDHNKYLKSVIYGDVSKSINISYYNSPCRAHATHLDMLPLYLITFYKKSANQSIQAQVFTITFLLISSLFLYIFFQCVMLLILERSHRGKEAKNIIIELTRPKMQLNERYKFLIRMYAIILLIMLLFLSYLDGLPAISAIFVCVTATFAYSYFVMNNSNKEKRSIWISLTAINAVILILLNIAYFSVLNINNEDCHIFIWFQITLFAGISLGHIFNLLAFPRENTEGNEKSITSSVYVRNYVALLLSILILFGIIPIFKFYDISHDKETEIRIKHKLVDLVRQKEARDKSLNDRYIRLLTRDNNQREQRKDSGIYVSCYYGTDFISKERLTPDTNTSTDLFGTMVCYFRTFYDDYIIQNKYLIYSGTTNSNMQWEVDKDTMKLRYATSLEEEASVTPVRLQIKSSIPKTSFLLPYQGENYTKGGIIIKNFLFWFIIAIVILLNYFLIRLVVRRIFSLQVVDIFAPQSFRELIEEQWETNKHLFISRLSPVDTTDELEKDKFSGSEDEVYDWSLRQEIDKTKKFIKDLYKKRPQGTNKTTEQKVLIRNFDYNFNDTVVFEDKISTIREMMSFSNLKLIVLTQVPPEIILEHYKEKIEKAKKDEEDCAEWIRLHEKFGQLCNSLVSMYYPVHYDSPLQEDEINCMKPKNENAEKLTKTEMAQKFLEKELDSCNYLSHYKDTTKADFFKTDTVVKDCNIAEDQIISKIHTLAGKYYQGILDSCTVEEKNVLYDMADDMILNSRNFTTIYGLLEKGIFRKKCDTITFLNRSFRRYVLISQDKASASGLELKVGKEGGTWQGYKITIFMVIIGLFIFIGMANPGFMEDLNALFIVIGGGIAVITGVLSLLSKRSKTGIGGSMWMRRIILVISAYFAENSLFFGE